MTPKTRILICGILPPPHFGHSMMYKMLMDSSFKEAFEIIFLNMDFWSYEQHKRITVSKIGKLFKYFFQYIFLIIIHRPRYVLYNMSFDKMPFLKDFLFCMTGRLLGCRIVLHDMGQYVKELYDSSGSFYKMLIRFFLRHTTASIILGEKPKRVYDGLLESRRTIAVLGSVEDSRKAGQGGASQRKEDGKIRVLYFSFLSVSKGVWTALKAAAEVCRHNSNIQFIFAGPVESPRLQEEITKYIKAHQLQNAVSLVGYVGSDEERTRYFRSVDIFIFPTHRDVFGLVLLHALAEGVPVVASIEGAVPEIIEDGENGFLIPKGEHQKFAEKILLLAADASLRERIGRRNRERFLQKFTVEKYGERMIQAFEKIDALN